MSPLQPGAILPEVFVAGGACAVLLLQAALEGRGGSGRAGSRTGILVAVVATLSLGLAVWHAASVYSEGVALVFQAAHPMLVLDRFSAMAICVLGLAALICVWLSITYLQALHINHGEYYALLLLSTAGMFCVVSSVNLMATFLGIELTSLPLFALAGFDRRKSRSNEAALKYFASGVFASSLGLFGMALLYGATGQLGYAGLRESFELANPLASTGLALVVAVCAFKMAAPPFHQWSPDVQEGAPACVSAFVSVAVKATGLLLLLRLLGLGLPDLGPRLEQVFWLLALLAIGIGNLLALVQTNVKRMLAYSGIAHTGYLLIAMAAGTPAAYSAAFFYLFVYVFMNLGAFAVVIVLAQGGRESEGLEDYAGLARHRPALALAATLFFLALAGVPGTAGFVARFQLFAAAIEADQITLVLLASAASAVSLAYYLRIPTLMYMKPATQTPRPELASNEFVVLLLCTTATLYYGFDFDLTFFEEAIRAIQP